jgi:hypothetical protein
MKQEHTESADCILKDRRTKPEAMKRAKQKAELVQ